MKTNTRSIAALEKLRMELKNWENRYHSHLWPSESQLLWEADRKISEAIALAKKGVS